MSHRIRVNGLTIGWMDTPGEDRIMKTYHGAEDGWLEEAEKGRPFGRLLKPDEVARAVAFLASAESGLMTGSIIDFDQQVLRRRRFDGAAAGGLNGFDACIGRQASARLHGWTNLPSALWVTHQVCRTRRSAGSLAFAARRRRPRPTGHGDAIVAAIERKPSKFASPISIITSAGEAIGENTKSVMETIPRPAPWRVGQRHRLAGIGREAHRQRRVTCGDEARLLGAHAGDRIDQDVADDSLPIA